MSMISRWNAADWLGWLQFQLRTKQETQLEGYGHRTIRQLVDDDGDRCCCILVIIIDARHVRAVDRLWTRAECGGVGVERRSFSDTCADDDDGVSPISPLDTRTAAQQHAQQLSSFSDPSGSFAHFGLQWQSAMWASYDMISARDWFFFRSADRDSMMESGIKTYALRRCDRVAVSQN